LVYNYVLRYISPEDTEGVVAEMARVLRTSSGLVVVSDLALPHLRAADRQLLGIWSDGPRFERAMTERGFRLVRKRYPLLSFMHVYRKGS